MRIAILVLLVLAAGVAGSMWLAGLGGTVEIKVGDSLVATSFPMAVLIAAIAFLVLHAILSVIGAIRRWPRRARVTRTLRRREQGDAAVTRTLIALAAGTGDAARVEVRKARGLLGDTPQTLLLAAEAERISGNEEGAAEVFRQLAGRDDARFLGLRGLLRQAMQKGDWDAARAIAKEAEAVQPGAFWLREERTQLALETRDWREALALATPEQPRAQLALAAAEQESDPKRKLELERQAFQFDKGFAPAAIAFSNGLRQAGSLRKARAVLEEAWQAAPHPDLAEPYLVVEPDALSRLRATEALIRRNPAAPESRLLLARSAIAAGQLGKARGALEPLIASGEADRRAYLLMAELVEAEKGDAGRVAALREEAEAAKPAPRWLCAHCGAEHTYWKPVCTACDTAGQLNWTAEAPPAEPVATRPAA
ncbi:heme biosynthesis HemY N-terminal domain-containing protein [Paracraurococcus lichenis]|uniref:Heme biosynthesis HemY N-terminal domain-containing protein n=1 Tax=Paracraurococcus lichenis TaxID=3064888 RepID=A0ABT9DVW3_9PROT|nr:heme biosynthesis HemY N-terminal domain-containing protein [Paracraurococcus sp. LOR1-02]MDO9708028.1 heme biosynthesis HemY N-terminal domain-containing protein [Paracraurococcus sp. LOR1-02]